MLQLSKPMIQFIFYKRRLFNEYEGSRWLRPFCKATAPFRRTAAELVGHLKVPQKVRVLRTFVLVMRS